jgi:hypothetical protein
VVGIELEVFAGEVSVLESTIVLVLFNGIVGVGRGTRFVLGVTSNHGDIVGRAIDQGFNVLGWKHIAVQNGLEDQRITGRECGNPPNGAVGDAV